MASCTVFRFFYDLQLEILVGSPSLKNIIRVHWQSPAQAFWEGSAALKSSIIGRISPPSTHSELAAEAAAMSRWQHSKHRRAQHEQHTVLMFLPHTARQSSSTRLGAANCLQTATPPPPLLRVLSDVLLWKKKRRSLLNYGELGNRCLRFSRG